MPRTAPVPAPLRPDLRRAPRRADPHRGPAGRAAVAGASSRRGGGARRSAHGRPAAPPGRSGTPYPGRLPCDTGAERRGERGSHPLGHTTPAHRSHSREQDVGLRARCPGPHPPARGLGGPGAVSFEGPGAADDCALSGDVLVCRLRDEPTRQTRLEARDASDGSRLWSYPAEGEATGLLGVGGLDVDDRHAYVTAADGEGFEVLDLSDGKPVARLPGRTGYDPSVVRVHDGRIFTSYAGGAGAGLAANMLFRAYDADDRTQVWERVIPWAFPPSLDIVGDRVWLTGSQATFTLDPETGRTLAEAPWNCDRRIRGALYDACNGRVVDARTLRPVGNGTYPGIPEAVSREGLLLVEGDGRRAGSRYIAAVDVRSGDERWTVPWTRGDSVVVAGDRLLVFGGDGVRTFALADGAPGAALSTVRNWPLEGGTAGSKVQPSVVLVSGGAYFLAFGDGTVMTAPVP
ncbi:hypothetical protein EQG64_01795 [Streptomyces sp. S6]|nr:hypothetical protein EQG64_01795 [Streptomyces sp. S6]